MEQRDIQYNLLNLPSKITYQDGSMMDYVYFYLTDHLGNNRVVVNASGSVEQVNHYYPYGGLMGESTNGDVQRYKYNGKELDRMGGLNWYDYGARHMDAARGVFTTMDPLAEKYYDISPYAYCKDNPIRYKDENGDSITIDQQAEIAIYNGLEKGSNIKMKFNNGVLDPSSISDIASKTDDTFLQDLYEISKNPQMVELKVTESNEFIMEGLKKSDEWYTPYELNDYDLNLVAQSFMRENGLPMGKHIKFP